MKTKEFIEVYEGLEASIDYEEFMEQYIYRTYVPFAEKLDVAFRIAKHSTHKVLDDGKEIFHVNSVLRHILYTMSIVDLYTEINVDFDNIVEEYDMLDEYDLLDWFSENIPEREQNKLYSLVESYVNDVYMNESNIVNCIDNKLEAIRMVFETLVDSGLTVLQNSLSNIDLESDQVKEFMSKITKELDETTEEKEG